MSSSSIASLFRPPVAPPRRSSDIARIIQVFGNTRRRFSLADPRYPGAGVKAWPAELLEVVSTALRKKVDEMFVESPPFNDATKDLSFEKHKYQHTKEEWHKIIDLALSRLFTHDALQQCEQRNMACWLSCGRRKGKADNYSHIKIGHHEVRIGKYLRFLVADDDERALIWNNVGDVSWHCSHLCHNTLCINPYHMVMEENRLNFSRNSCLRQWNQTTNQGRSPALHGVSRLTPCPPKHQPKCFFTDNRTGFVVPANNYRKPVNLVSTALRNAVGLSTYHEPDSDGDSFQTPMQQMLANWKSLKSIDRIDSSWEHKMAAEWERAEWRVAHGNYRIQHHAADRLQHLGEESNEADHAGSSAAHPMEID
jgi:hypothetical protein